MGYPVFHNHLVVDTLTTVFPFGSEPFVRLREQFWLDVFAEAAHSGRSLIFTFAPEATVRPGFPARVRETVERHGGSVRFVRLAVSLQEQERRIENPDRREFHKLNDLETLRRTRLADLETEQPPVDLEVDTEHHDAEASAAVITERLGLEPQVTMERCPSDG